MKVFKVASAPPWQDRPRRLLLSGHFSLSSFFLSRGFLPLSLLILFPCLCWFVLSPSSLCSFDPIGFVSSLLSLPSRAFVLLASFCSLPSLSFLSSLPSLSSVSVFSASPGSLFLAFSLIFLSMEVYTFARFAAAVSWLEDLPFYRPTPDPHYFAFLLRACIHYPCARLYSTLCEEAKGWQTDVDSRYEALSVCGGFSESQSDAEMLQKLLFGPRGKSTKQARALEERTKQSSQKAVHAVLTPEESREEVTEAGGRQKEESRRSQTFRVSPVPSTCASHSPLSLSETKWRLAASPTGPESPSCRLSSPWSHSSASPFDSSTRATLFPTPRDSQSPLCEEESVSETNDALKSDTGADSTHGGSRLAAPAEVAAGVAQDGRREAGAAARQGERREANREEEAEEETKSDEHRREGEKREEEIEDETQEERRSERVEEREKMEILGKETAEKGEDAFVTHPPEALASMLYYAFFTSVQPTQLTVNLVAAWLRAHTHFPLSACRAAINYLQATGSFHFVVDDEVQSREASKPARRPRSVPSSPIGSSQAPVSPSQAPVSPSLEAVSSQEALPSFRETSAPSQEQSVSCGWPLSFLTTFMSRSSSFFRRSASAQAPLSLETTPGWLYGAAPIRPHYRPLILQLFVNFCQFLFVSALTTLGFVAVSPRCMCRTCSSTVRGCMQRRKPRPEVLRRPRCLGEAIPLKREMDGCPAAHSVEKRRQVEVETASANRENARNNPEEDEEATLEGGLKFLRFFLYLPPTVPPSPPPSPPSSPPCSPSPPSSPSSCSSSFSEGRHSAPGVKAPIVLIHGFGFGLLPYILHALLLVIRQRFWTPAEERRPIVLLEFAWLGLDGQGAQLMRQSQAIEEARARAVKRMRGREESACGRPRNPTEAEREQKAKELLEGPDASKARKADFGREEKVEDARRSLRAYAARVKESSKEASEPCACDGVGEKEEDAHSRRLPPPLLWTDIVPLMPAICRSLADFLEDLHRVQLEDLQTAMRLAKLQRRAEDGKETGEHGEAGAGEEEARERGRSAAGEDVGKRGEKKKEGVSSTWRRVNENKLLLTFVREDISLRSPGEEDSQEAPYLERHGVQVDVVAHSYGTGVTSCLHMMHPSLLRRCVLVDPVCFFPNCTVKAQLVHRQPWQIRLLPRHSGAERGREDPVDPGSRAAETEAFGKKVDGAFTRTTGVGSEAKGSSGPRVDACGGLQRVSCPAKADLRTDRRKGANQGVLEEAARSCETASSSNSWLSRVDLCALQRRRKPWRLTALAPLLRVALLHAIDRFALFFYWLLVYRELGTRITTSRQLQGHEYLDRGGLLRLQDRLMVVLGSFDLISPAAHIKAFMDCVAPRVECLYCPGAHHGVVAFMPSVLATIDKFLAT
ncbi:alpha/beta hydrolase family protein [Toxoplasma gondii TgCatPRC2]|uniref:Alpha/beta hydrolase family protein n=1 Tax=Toxoplasma gondii TgCatPRC2 TaxID=1130821 RepID=A0A151H7D0_TOXGO|nr:alpha/beta hydrolase family protein [Toxoplasma gondii TgCatPRC2]